MNSSKAEIFYNDKPAGVLSKENGKYYFNPSHSHKLNSGDTLIVIGNPEQMHGLNTLVG